MGRERRITKPVRKILTRVVYEMRRSDTLVFDRNVLAKNFPRVDMQDIILAEAITVKVFAELAKGVNAKIDEKVIRRADAALVNKPAGSLQLEGLKIGGHHTHDGFSDRPKKLYKQRITRD